MPVDGARGQSKSEQHAAGLADQRSGSKREVPMEVLVLGLCRTGTASIRTALEELGYEDTYHMKSASVENPLDCELWMDAVAAKWDGRGSFRKEDWDGLLGKCMAVTDLPCAAFAPELIATYPSAKVIYSKRNVDSWYRSVLNTIEKEQQSSRDWLLSYINKDIWRQYTMVHMLWTRMFDGDFSKNGKKYFEQHREEIYRIMASRQQDLLDKDIPDYDFPNKNTPEDFHGARWRQRRKQVVDSIVTVLPVIAGLSAIGAGVFLAMR
ncbi:MAG: hypothetical protein Q9164_005333 [Protoblastenia rupestris]